MEKPELINKIRELLKTSTIPGGYKEVMEMLIPKMDDTDLDDVFKILQTEQQKLTKLGEKRKRLELKQKIMEEKLKR